MKKVLNTFRYGDAKTKLVLLLTLFAGLGAAASLVFAFLLKMMFLYFAAIVLVFVAIALAQTFMISGGNADITRPQGPSFAKQETEETLKAAPPLKTDQAKTPGKPFVQKEPLTYAEERSPRKWFKRNDNGVGKGKGNPLPVRREQTEEEGRRLDRIKYRDMKKGKKHPFRRFFKNVVKKLHIGKQNEEQPAFHPETEQSKTGEEKAGDLNVENWFRHMEGAPELDEEAFQQRKRDTGEAPGIPEAKDERAIKKEDERTAETVDEHGRKRLVIVRQATDEDFAAYDKKVIKKTLHKYKVKRDHRMIMVDKCEELYIKQTPAYVWVNDKEFHLLLIEQEPRHIVLPTFRLREMTYLKKQVVNEDVDYGPFKKKSTLAEMFRPYLPDYTHSTVIDDMSAYKNLYGFGPGIYVTNNSAKQIFDLLAIDFRVDDKVTLSSKVNIYFKEIYKHNILLRDNVIDANGYADRVAKTLDNMAHSTISYNEFKETLSLMVKNKLITQEFAGYYMDVRDKASAGK